MASARRSSAHDAVGWWAAPACVGVAFLLLPFVALVVRVDWTHWATLVGSPSSLAALRLSLVTCAVAMLCCAVLGTPIAATLAWGRGRWVGALRVITTIPMVLPPVVAGLLLLLTWGRRGVLGSVLAGYGIEVGFTTTAVVIAQVFVALPYFVMGLEGALRARGLAYESTARSLGAGRWRVFRAVTLPLSWPAVVAAASLAFARALGEFGATLTFAGSLEGVTRTMPLEIYLQREIDSDQALALAVVLIGVAALSVAVAGAVGRRPPSVRRRATPPLVPAGQHAASTAVPVALGGRVTVPERGVDVRLDVRPGARLALIGPNGSGKSTTLDAIAAGAGPRAATLPQRPVLFPHLSVVDNVAFPLRARGVAAASARARALAELAAVGLDGLADRAPTQLSGGEAQRAALARALTLDPGAVLLDEPMAGLDARAAATVRRALRARLADVGATLLLVTHDPADVAALGCSVAILDAGRVVAELPWRELPNSDVPFVRDFLAGVDAWR